MRLVVVFMLGLSAISAQAACTGPANSGKLLVNWKTNEAYIVGSVSIQVIDLATCAVRRSLPMPTDEEVLAFIQTLNGTISPTPMGPFGPNGPSLSPNGLIAVGYTSLSQGSFNYSGGLDGSVALIDPAGNYRLIDGGVNITVNATAFSADGKTLYTASYGPGVILGSNNSATPIAGVAAIDVDSGKIIQSWYDTGSKALLTLPNGKVAGFSSGSAIILDPATATTTKIAVDINETGIVPGIGNSGGDSKVYLAGLNNGHRYTVVIDGDSATVLKELPFGASYFAFPSTEAYAYVGFFEGSGIGAYNMFQGQPANPSGFPTEPQASIYGMAANRQPDGSDVVVVLENGTLKVFTVIQPSPMDYAVVNAGNFAEGPLVPGEIVSLFGHNFNDQQPTGAQSTPLPTSINGTQVTFNGVAGALFFVSAGQINVQVPTSLGTSGTVDVQVNGNLGSSNVITYQLSAMSAALFFDPLNGQVAVDPSTNNWSSLVQLVGQVITTYGTGFGATNPGIPSGMPSPLSPLARLDTTPTVTLCGQQAQVTFAGLTPTLVGLYQVNLVVPPACASATNPAVPDYARVQVTSGGSVQ